SGGRVIQAGAPRWPIHARRLDGAGTEPVPAPSPFPGSPPPRVATFAPASRQQRTGESRRRGVRTTRPERADRWCRVRWFVHRSVWTRGSAPAAQRRDPLLELLDARHGRRRAAAGLPELVVAHPVRLLPPGVV